MDYIYPCKPNQLAPDSSYFLTLDNDDRWVAEVKKNGWRCLVYRENGSVTLYTRHHTRILDALPNLRNYLTVAVPPGTILDGELVHHRTKGTKEFFYLFDMLSYCGSPVVNEPLSHRRTLIDSMVLGTAGLVEVARQTCTGKVALFNRIIEEKNEADEGIVLKKLSSKYLPSQTSCLQHPYWLKVKRPGAHLFQN